MKRIYIKSWMLLKPYHSSSSTDTYYLGIANKIYRIIQKEYGLILNMYLDEEGLETLSCFLASYFEDIISQTNIWNCFVKNHRELYGKNLPFYELDDYYEGEINPQDIAFLTWYFLNSVQDDLFLTPHNDFFHEIANDIMEILEEEYEYAPENEILLKFYTLDENETDYYIIRNFIDTILFKTYLFLPDTGKDIIDKEMELIRENDENLLMYLREMRDNLVHKSRTSLLGLIGKEWAAAILGDHPLINDLLALSPRLAGFFLYKGKNEKYIHLEHIASGRKFELLKMSFDGHIELTEIDTILYLGMVNWQKDWWFSGISFSKEFDADIILNEKNSIHSRMSVNFLEKDTGFMRDHLDLQQKAFLKYNNGQPIAFLKPDEIDDFITNFQIQYEKELGLSEEEIKNAKARSKKDGYFGGDDLDIAGGFQEDFEIATCYFNPNSGIEFAMDVSSAFPVAFNPYFEKAKTENDIFEVLISPGISKEMTQYSVGLIKDKLPFFKTGKGAKLYDDLDFLLRFWKKEAYFTAPNISYIGRTED